ncbi:MAG: TlpA disulfide reductase family protein, partial [Bacteroidota bacterium]
EAEVGNEAFIKRHTNQTLPDFELVDMEGNKISSEDLKGKRVHINFWSTTCKPCIQEFPELNQLKEKYEKEGFVFLAFAPEPKTKVSKVLSRFPLDYQVIPEAKAYYEQLGIDGYPKNFFIDKAGKIIKVTDGTHFKGEMKDGQLIMIPDNFKIYDKIVQEMD